MADSERDFANPLRPARSATSPVSSHMTRQQSIGGHLLPSGVSARSPPPISTDHSHPATHSTGYFSPRGAASPRSPFGRRSSTGSAESAPVRTRPRRSSTVRTYEAPSRPNWEPGAEPGIDTTAAGSVDDGDKPHALCDITVVDFCEEDVVTTDLDNLSLAHFLTQPRHDWVDCRWICVNGIDYGVIAQLSNHKKLHPLAIEDLMNTRSRPKVDWYSDHAFIVLSLQKLVWLTEEKDEQHDEYGNDHSFKAGRSIPIWKRAFDMRPTPAERKATKATEDVLEKMDSKAFDSIAPVRTLQRWRGGPNMDRIEYMESKSALTKMGLAVSVEQVCIFLTDDNTVITFFEHSSTDVLEPISSRLSSNQTMLRRSSDASLLVQAIIDAIIDLAMPVAAAYEDAFSNLELEVLTDPDMYQPRELYILTSEINLLRNTISPFTNLIHSLRGHRPEAVTAPATSTGGRPPMTRLVTTSTVNITPLTLTYLSDIEDHVIMLSASLDRMRMSAEQLTSLIFNTLGAHQNESMKQLTLVTIFFLPLTFLVGYFGMNFEDFYTIHHFSDAFLWYVAIPVIFVTCLFMMRNYLRRSLETAWNKWWMRRNKKRRVLKERLRIAHQHKLARARTMPMINEEHETDMADKPDRKPGVNGAENGTIV